MSLYTELRTAGQPLLKAQFDHPVIRGIGSGELEPEVFRAWLEQDHLFLLSYVRVFARLAWQSPPGHLADLVDLAHTTLHDELALHRELAAPFGADLDGARPSPQCTAYTRFLLDSAADYGIGLAALLPCMWGYSELGRGLADTTGRYARWVSTYSDPGFAALAARCGQMLDEVAPDPGDAHAAFITGMYHELAFWDAR